MIDEEFHTPDESLESEPNQQNETIFDAKKSSENISHALLIPILNKTRILIQFILNKTLLLIHLIANQTFLLIQLILIRSILLILSLLDDQTRIQLKRKLNEEESSDSLKETETIKNTKHPSRKLKDCKCNGMKLHNISNQENKLTGNLNDYGQKIVTVNLNTKFKNETETKVSNVNEYCEDDPILTENTISIKDENKSLYVHITQLYFRSILKNKLFHSILGNKYPSYLQKPVNPKFMKSSLEIYKKFSHLMDKDIKNNVFPLIFNQIVIPPLFVESFLPIIDREPYKEGVEELKEEFDNSEAIKTMLDLAEISQDEISDNTIPKTLKIIHEYFKKLKIDDNKKNRRLAELYEKNLERLFKILNKDWRENEAPVIFYNLQREMFFKNPILIEKLTSKPKYVKKDKIGKEDTFLHFLETLKSKRKNRFLEDKDISDISEDSAEEDESIMKKGFNYISDLNNYLFSNYKPGQ